MDAPLRPTRGPKATPLVLGKLTSLKMSLANAIIDLSARSEAARQAGDLQRAGDLAQQAVALAREAWRLRRLERNPQALPPELLTALARDARRCSTDLLGANETLAASGRLIALLTRLSQVGD